MPQQCQIRLKLPTKDGYSLPLFQGSIFVVLSPTLAGGAK
jgi:hypothetical protein